MNNQMIKNIITSNNLPCPEFKFENPLLDKDVARALAKSFVKILDLSQKDLKINNSLRLSILENIRRVCQAQPVDHLRTDENITTLLSEVYKRRIKDSKIELFDSTDKDLDAFLIRNIKDMDLDSNYKISLSPENVQALINLNSDSISLNTLFTDIIHWNCTDSKNVHILKQIWTSETSITEDISVKLKSVLENILLEICYNILNETISNIEEPFVTNISLKTVVNKSSSSANCFQICCCLVNHLFVKTNFDPKIQMFAKTFVEEVKKQCSHLTMSVLYPSHLSHITVLLDIELDELPTSLTNNYIETVVKYLSDLQLKSQNDLIMLLSHYPQWFDIYFEHNSE